MMNNLRDWDAGCNAGLIEALFHATEDAHMHDLQQELFNIMEATLCRESKRQGTGAGAGSRDRSGQGNAGIKFA